jgi:hypothetical protein
MMAAAMPMPMLLRRSRTRGKARKVLRQSQSAPRAALLLKALLKATQALLGRRVART